MVTIDKILLLKSLNISVLDTCNSNKVILLRYGVTMYYDVSKFLKFSSDNLISDVLQCFKQKTYEKKENKIETKSQLIKRKKKEIRILLEQLNLA
ncbi:MAG: hypothetical protein ACOCVF_02600 [bacterium]